MKTYWHLATQNSILLNNVYLGKGTTPTISAMRRMPGLQGVTSPYAAQYESSAKEQLWEKVRQSIDPQLPSRMGGLFAFDDEASADAMAAAWFAGEQRHKIRVQVLPMLAATVRVDARWLESVRSDWESATKYWQGEITDRPLPEVIIDGTVYFPDWQSPPFGLGVGLGSR